MGAKIARVSRMRCSASARQSSAREWCTADPGPPQSQSSWRSRVRSAPRTDCLPNQPAPRPRCAGARDTHPILAPMRFRGVGVLDEFIDCALNVADFRYMSSEKFANGEDSSNLLWQQRDSRRSRLRPRGRGASRAQPAPSSSKQFSLAMAHLPQGVGRNDRRARGRIRTSEYYTHL